MQLDPRSVAVGYGLAKMQMSAELADLRAAIEAEWAALRSELAAAQAEVERLNFVLIRRDLEFA
jgi:hypothetical protein